MAPIIIPEGFVFVPRKRGENVAAALMEAADSVKADRHTSVRTVSGGYHVVQEVADAYAAAQPAADEVDDEAGNDQTGETDEEKAAREAAEAEAAAAAEAAAKAAEERGYPDGDPTGDWTVKNLEAWAGARDPKVDLGSGDKASKLQAALDSIQK